MFRATLIALVVAVHATTAGALKKSAFYVKAEVEKFAPLAREAGITAQ